MPCHNTRPNAFVSCLLTLLNLHPFRARHGLVSEAPAPETPALSAPPVIIGGIPSRSARNFYRGMGIRASRHLRNMFQEKLRCFFFFALDIMSQNIFFQIFISSFWCSRFAEFIAFLLVLNVILRARNFRYKCLIICLWH